MGGSRVHGIGPWLAAVRALVAGLAKSLKSPKSQGQLESALASAEGSIKRLFVS